MLLHSLIKQLSQDDFLAFTHFLARRNRRSDTKNIRLAHLLREDPLPDRPDLIIYKKQARNAYHALCKRLFDALIDFTAARSFETESSQELDVFKYLLAARIFYENQQDLAARKVLLRAQQMAQEIDLYSGLSEIYHTKIQYAHRHSDLELAQCIKDFNNNKAQHHKEEQLNMAYATLKQRLSNGDHFSQPLDRLIRDVFERYQISIDQSLSFKALFQLLEIINTLAHQSHDFYGALPLIAQIEDVIHSRVTHSSKHLYYRIHILYFLANAYFRSRQFSQSEVYIDRLQDAIALENGRYYKRFRESALLLKALHLNYTGQGLKAITLLENHSAQKLPLTPDLTLALGVFYVQQHQCKQALGVLRLLQHSPKWYLKKEGVDWLIKKELITLIIHLELEHIDLVESLLRSFKRNYTAHIAQESRLKIFLDLFTSLFQSPQIVDDTRFRESVRLQFQSFQKTQVDLFLLSFYSWLVAKTQKVSVYKTTMGLLQRD
ncbi:MAG: hypothetical protein ABNH00_11430 [Dokdonia sp.]|jgi:hypothetical protein